MAETRVRVAGLHGSPLRALAYMDVAAAAGLGLGGVVNGVTLVPEPGRATSLERALFGQPGVASVRPASSDTEALRTTVSSFTEAIQIVGFITLALGVLVAFTTVSVSVDERRREYATMFAFGFPPRSGLRVTVVESLIIGLLGTATGIGLGLVAAAWIVGTLIADTFPDLGAEMALTGGSVLLALGVGLLAVTTAPLLTFRRMRSMDVPSTLRVVE
jgi:putative ABC transport system permease protein